MSRGGARGGAAQKPLLVSHALDALIAEEQAAAERRGPTVFDEEEAAMRRERERERLRAELEGKTPLDVFRHFKCVPTAD